MADRPGMRMSSRFPGYTPLGTEESVAEQAQRLRELLEIVGQCCRARDTLLSGLVGLPQAELHALTHFGPATRLTATGLGDQLDVPLSHAAALLDKLTARGMLRRCHPDDPHRTLFQLSPKGRQLRGHIEATVQELHEDLLAQLAPEDRDALLFTLGTLKNSMRAMRERMGYPDTGPLEF